MDSSDEGDEQECQTKEEDISSSTGAPRELPRSSQPLGQLEAGNNLGSEEEEPKMKEEFANRLADIKTKEKPKPKSLPFPAVGGDLREESPKSSRRGSQKEVPSAKEEELGDKPPKVVGESPSPAQVIGKSSRESSPAVPKQPQLDAEPKSISDILPSVPAETSNSSKKNPKATDKKVRKGSIKMQGSDLDSASVSPSICQVDEETFSSAKKSIHRKSIGKMEETVMMETPYMQSLKTHTEKREELVSASSTDESIKTKKVSVVKKSGDIEEMVETNVATKSTKRVSVVKKDEEIIEKESLGSAIGEQKKVHKTYVSKKEEAVTGVKASSLKQSTIESSGAVPTGKKTGPERAVAITENKNQEAIKPKQETLTDQIKEAIITPVPKSDELIEMSSSGPKKQASGTPKSASTEAKEMAREKSPSFIKGTEDSEEKSNTLMNQPGDEKEMGTPAPKMGELVEQNNPAANQKTTTAAVPKPVQAQRKDSPSLTKETEDSKEKPKTLMNQPDDEKKMRTPAPKMGELVEHNNPAANQKTTTAAVPKPVQAQRKDSPSLTKGTEDSKEKPNTLMNQPDDEKNMRTPAPKMGELVEQNNPAANQKTTTTAVPKPVQAQRKDSVGEKSATDKTQGIKGNKFDETKKKESVEQTGETMSPAGAPAAKQPPIELSRSTEIGTEKVPMTQESGSRDKPGAIQQKLGPMEAPSAASQPNLLQLPGKGAVDSKEKTNQKKPRRLNQQEEIDGAKTLLDLKKLLKPVKV